MQEKDQKRAPERLYSPELETAADKQHEVIRDKVERAAERSREKSPESLNDSRLEARELARESKKPPETATEQSKAEKNHQPPISTKKARAQAFDNAMAEIQPKLSPSSRAFSKVIHQPAVERASEVAGKTIARPNAILGGSFTAFVAVLAVFLIARYYGYPLSGSETIVAFAAGWVLGVIFDYLRTMITGRPSA